MLKYKVKKVRNELRVDVYTIKARIGSITAARIESSLSAPETYRMVPGVNTS